MRSRGIAIALSVAVMLGGTGGVLAWSGGGGDGGNAAGSQYKPGKGCGDKNHQHIGRNECKKHHGHGGGGDGGDQGDNGHGNGHHHHH